VQVDLPRNWLVISDNQRITLDAWVAAKSRKLKTESSSSVLGFAANYYDDKGKTAGIFSIRYYPKQVVIQAEAKAATMAVVNELDAELKSTLTAGVEAAGNRVLEWRGTKKSLINGNTFFVTEYRRTSPQDIPFQARLIRMLDGGSSFTITVSYREDQHFFLGAITDHITSSIRK
jgi:hypothetical protein